MVVNTGETTRGSPGLLELLLAQKKFMESLAPELMYAGAFGAGKTLIGNEKAQFLSLKYPNNYGGIFRKVFNDLRFSTMESFFRYVIPGKLLERSKWDASNHVLTYPNGSVIVFRGLDDPTKIASMELGWAFVDEAIEIEREDWDMIQGRLRLPTVPFRQLFAATNPGPDTHWLFDKFLSEEGLADPDTEAFSSNTLENIHLPEDYIKRLQKFTGRYYDRYVLGKWVGYEGIVYDMFEPTTQVIPRFDIPDEWTRYRVIDFGYENPFVCQWWAVSPSGDWFRYREIYKSHRIVEDHAKSISKWTGNENIRATYADHDAEGRATLNRYKIHTLKANKDVSLGIQTTSALMSLNKVYFLQDSLVEVDQELKDAKKPFSTEGELPSYKWKKRVSLNDPEEPVKLNDHGMDAMRYILHTTEGKSMNFTAPIVGRSISKWPISTEKDRPTAIFGNTGSNRSWSGMR